MDRDLIIAKVLQKLSRINTISVNELIDKIKRGVVPKASLPRTVFSFAERNNYNDFERKELMEYLIKEDIHKMSAKHKQGMEFLRDTLFKIPSTELVID